MKSPSFKRSSHQSNSGFALIISLTLVSFLLILMLSLSSMMLVSSKHASVAVSAAVARKHAMFAMQMAVVQLQKYVGPDQRVTATGSIMDKNIDDESNDEPHSDINAPYFTGVWSTDPVHLADEGMIAAPVDPHTNPAEIKNAGPIAWLTSDPRGVYDNQPPFSPMYSAQIRSSRTFRQKQIPSSQLSNSGAS